MIANEMLHVLLVEDNPGDVALVRLYLAEDPHGRIELSHAPSIRAAKEAMRPGRVDLILLDLGLPDGTGVDVVAAIRQLAPHVPIVVLTGASNPGHGLEALKRDAQDFLVKDDLDAATLRRSIHFAMERHRWQQHYRRQLSVSPDGMIVLDKVGRVRFVNQAATEMLGEAPAKVQDLPESVRFAGEEPTDLVLETGRAAEARAVETVWQGEQAFLVTLHDITDRRRAEETMDHLAEELKQANERLARLVSTDHLTDVLNRRGVEQALGVELRRMRRSGEGLVAILVDYDNFKNINDAYGYAVGDAALRALTKGVHAALRAGDHVGRVGGDEFLVLLPGATLDEGFAVAEKLRRTIKGSTLPVADGSVELSASLAVGCVDSHFVSLEEVLASVNGALKKSKVEGKDRVSGNRRSEAGEASHEPSRDHDFDVNLVELGIALQAILRVDTEEVVGFEALTRGPAGSYAAPSDLFRAAFERNVLTTLDLRALATSLRVLGDNDGIEALHVNLFPSTILSAPTDRISSLLSDAGGAGRLCVELSEQQFLGDPAYLREPLAALRRSGIRVAIDDVGFGRSSIEALLVLEPDIVKIDGSCVRAVDSDRERRGQLRRLLAMLSSIGTEVIVEGVETQAELAVLRDMGVAYGQGFLWGRPERAMTP